MHVSTVAMTRAHTRSRPRFYVSSGFKFSQIEMSTCHSLDIRLRDRATDYMFVGCRGRPSRTATEVFVRRDRPGDHLELLGRHLPNHGRRELEARDVVESEGFVTPS